MNKIFLRFFSFYLFMLQPNTSFCMNLSLSFLLNRFIFSPFPFSFTFHFLHFHLFNARVFVCHFVRFSFFFLPLLTSLFCIEYAFFSIRIFFDTHFLITPYEALCLPQKRKKNSPPVSSSFISDSLSNSQVK